MVFTFSISVSHCKAENDNKLSPDMLFQNKINTKPLQKEPESVDTLNEQERLLNNLISLLDSELKTGDPLFIADFYRILSTYMKYKKNTQTNRHTGALTLIDKGVIQKLLDVALGTLKYYNLNLILILLRRQILQSKRAKNAPKS